MTRDDLGVALVPIQKQLDDLAAQGGEHQRAIEQLDIDVARIATKLSITARPVP